MKLVNIGFGNMVSAQRVVAIVSPDSAPVKRLGQEARSVVCSSTPALAAKPGRCW